MLGVSGATLSSACFGLSRSLPAMIISRSLAGALSGNVAVVSSMLSELTDETNQGKGECCTSFDGIITLSPVAMFPDPHLGVTMLM